MVVLLPLLAIFWISVKPVALADLRPPAVVLREDLRGDAEAVGDAAIDPLPPAQLVAGSADPRASRSATRSPRA